MTERAEGRPPTATLAYPVSAAGAITAARQPGARIGEHADGAESHDAGPPADGEATGAAADTSAPADGHDRDGVSQWAQRLLRVRLSNVRTAFSASAAVLMVNAVYFLATPDGPNRPYLWAVQGLAITSGVLVALPPEQLRRGQAFLALQHGWTTSQLVFISVGFWLDGGLTSPLVPLLFVPLSIAAVSFRPRAVLPHASTAVAAVLFVGATSDTLALGHGLLWTATLAITTLVCSAVAQNVWRLGRELDRTNAELRRLSRTDSLTGCLNHRSFHEELDAALARSQRTGRPLAVVVLDVDGFKRVNDEHGHPVGDEVLQAVATALRSRTRSGDVVGRTGGDEFGVLLPDATVSEAEGVAERVRHAVGGADSPVAVSASAGLAAAPEHGTASQQVIRAADEALYTAKRAGRDRLVVAPLPAATAR